MADDEEPQDGYRWESEYEKTWEAIQEDESGNLQASVHDYIHRTKRQRMLTKRNVRLGMMRHLYVIVDMSAAMSETDLRPTRFECTIDSLKDFIEKFFDENPISQLGIITTSEKRAIKRSELSGNSQKHLEQLNNLREMPLLGEPSLQNALQLAAHALKPMPSHSSREILVIMGSLTTCDPGNIHTTIDKLKAQGIRCSVIGLAAEVRVCRHLTKVTGGSYSVAMDESHVSDLLGEYITPPPVQQGQIESSLVRMGFPSHRESSTTDAGNPTPSLCACHMDRHLVTEGGKSGGESFFAGGYYCPQCGSKYCELPVECRVCSLTLVSAPHLARSYHHLFPLDNFVPVAPQPGETMKCFACRTTDTHHQSMYRCPHCECVFCVECDVFAHETLHACPGCASRPAHNNVR